MSTTQIQVQPTFRDQKCPVFFADGQPVVMWFADGVMHAQFRSVHLTDPLGGGAVEISPVVEITMPLPVFFSMLDGAKAQTELLEKQGIKRVPIAAVTPTAPGGGPAH